MPRGSKLAKETKPAPAPRKRRAPGIPAGIGIATDRLDKPIDLPERGPATANAAPPARVSVSVDTLITRADLGPGCKTFVAASQLIPLGLEAYPRVPA